MPPDSPVSFVNGLVVTSTQAWMALAGVAVVLLVVHAGRIYDLLDGKRWGYGGCVPCQLYAGAARRITLKRKTRSRCEINWRVLKSRSAMGSYLSIE
ncbi:hypothetical protein DFJ73DRAFT_807916 [Zopfochytrium polystomum]|nr:hypothetical protein DFJ73DRAFT_807916 [Zopfochytrium polystomum]